MFIILMLGNFPFWLGSFLLWFLFFFCHLGVFLFCSLGSCPKLVIFCAPLSIYCLHFTVIKIENSRNKLALLARKFEISIHTIRYLFRFVVLLLRCLQMHYLLYIWYYVVIFCSLHLFNQWCAKILHENVIKFETAR